MGRGIGISSPVFSLINFEEMIEKLEKHFEIWEIIAERKHHLKLIEKKLKECIERCCMKFKIHAPLSDINLASISWKIREASMNEILYAIETSHNVGVKDITIHPGHLSPMTIHEVETAREIVKSSLSILDKKVRNYDMNICVENMPRIKWEIFSRAEEIISCIEDTSFKICFDLGHANTSNTINEFLEISELFGNVHLHDNNGKRDEHLVLGMGNAPWEEVIRKLMNKYDGDWILEMNSVEEGIESKKIVSKLLR